MRVVLHTRAASLAQAHYAAPAPETSGPAGQDGSEAKPVHVNVRAESAPQVSTARSTLVAQLSRIFLQGLQALQRSLLTHPDLTHLPAGPELAGAAAIRRR